jgi:hypothetical protein
MVSRSARIRASTRSSILHQLSACGEFDPDRPDVTDSPFTVDAGHIQFETGLFRYALSRPDQQGVETEAFDIADTDIRLGVTNYAEIDLFVPLLNVVHTSFPISRLDTWKSGPAHWSYTPNSISLETTVLRSRVRWRLLLFRGSTFPP